MTATLETVLREKLGTRDSRKLRLQGKIPCSLQGDGENVNAAIDEEQFLAARRHHEHVFELALPKSETAMVRELQWDAFGERIIHVEFHRVDLNKETEAEVAIEFSGHPKGGVLNHLMTHVTVAAIPSKIPDKLELSVDELEAGHPLTAGDLPCPEGVRLVTPADAQIAVVATVRAETGPAEETEEGAEAPEATEGGASSEGDAG